MSSFLSGFRDGFLVEGLWGTVQGIGAIGRGIGSYLEFVGSFWVGGLDAASRTSGGQRVDALATAAMEISGRESAEALATAARKYGPTVVLIARDLPILLGQRPGTLSPQTRFVISLVNTTMLDIMAVIVKDLASKTEEEKARLLGTIFGVLLFEVALRNGRRGHRIIGRGEIRQAGVPRKSKSSIRTNDYDYDRHRDTTTIAPDRDAVLVREFRRQTLGRNDFTCPWR